MSEQYIRFKAPITYINKVAAIKAIRYLTGMGLKEAKDTSERIGEQSLKLAPSLTKEIYEEQCRILRVEGCEVGLSVEKLLEDLRNLAKQALEQHEDELAAEILQLVLVEKLRRKN